LIFHSGVIRLAQLAFAAVEDVLGQAVALFLQVAHPLDAPPVRFPVHVGQHMQSLKDPAEVGQSVTKLGGVAATLEHAYRV
jgi:hypothetical protein